MLITEIFKSIQGESSYAGLPCSFIRTTGCNLRCVWCDTEYAFHGGKEMTIDEVLQAIESHHCELVEVTGGEPLLQQDVPELCARLLDRKHKVLIETSGAQDISVLPEKVIKIMDVKCPESGMMEMMNWKNLDHLSTFDEIKFVINSRRDYDWAVEILFKYQLPEKNLVLFSPVYRKMEPEKLAEWILQDNLPVRFQIQLHKVLWGETPGR
ncbi:MAG: 7-carboxy-7-deazaguanine synthase [Acidobacteria bacterium]|nr:MAG: 7-carboxy-7-deazaguanine synthase [Acidobacteriota bacterium]